jgi:hypothetical protein
MRRLAHHFHNDTPTPHRTSQPTTMDCVSFCYFCIYLFCDLGNGLTATTTHLVEDQSQLFSSFSQALTNWAGSPDTTDNTQDTTPLSDWNQSLEYRFGTEQQKGEIFTAKI